MLCIAIGLPEVAVRLTCSHEYVIQTSVSSYGELWRKLTVRYKVKQSNNVIL